MLTLEEALAKYPESAAFTYGDGPELNAEILALVRAGQKTVTCDAWAAFEARGEVLPEVGRTDIALDWAGVPAVAVRTMAVERIRFCDIDAAHVAAMGEFENVEEFRGGYESYLRRAGLFAPDVEMMVETFELVQDFSITS